MCHCWNNLGMKGHVPSLVKMVITSLQPRLPRTNRKAASVCARRANACRQILAARILPEWLISFPSTCYDTRATFTVWALWLATDSKAAILNMKGFFFFFVAALCRISSVLKIFAIHIHFLFTQYFFLPPSTWHDAIIFKAAKFKTFEGDRCFNYARAGKHLIWGSQMHLIWSTQQLNPLAECTVLSESVTPMGKDFYITLWLHLSFKMLNLLTVS